MSFGGKLDQSCHSGPGGSAGQDILQEMTQLVSGDIKVRIQPYKLGQRTEDNFSAPSAGRSGVDRRHQHRELPRGVLSERFA